MAWTEPRAFLGSPRVEGTGAGREDEKHWTTAGCRKSQLIVVEESVWSQKHHDSITCGMAYASNPAPQHRQKGVCAMGHTLSPLPSPAPPCGHGRSSNPRSFHPSGRGGSRARLRRTMAHCRHWSSSLVTSSQPFPALADLEHAKKSTGARRVCTAGRSQGIGPSHRHTSDGQPPLDRGYASWHASVSASRMSIAPIIT